MYSIVNIICGYKLPDKVRNYLDEIGVDYEECGFKVMYSGYDDIPSYSGILLANFAAHNSVFAADLIKMLTPDEDKINQARVEMALTRRTFEEFLAEDEEITAEEKRELLDSIPTEPSVFLLWSTS